MSLPALANHMASQGRGPDTMLVHMAPSEVRGLQSLAMAHGGTLTINPETGLPEAGMLSSILPMIIGGALVATGVGAPLAAAMVGGFETIRTGDLKQGLMAGLGAYGGAGLAEGFMGAGAGSLAAPELTAANAGISDLASNAVGSTLRDAAGNLTQAGQEYVANIAAQTAPAEAVMNNASAWDKLSAGAKQVTSSPEAAMGFAKDNWKSLAAAATPLMADQAVQAGMPTTTTRPGQIRNFTYNPYGQTYNPIGSYNAADGGLMDSGTGGYNPGMLDFTQQSEPVVRMAEGGTPPQTVEDLYTSILGRPSDAGGAAFWQQQFGDTIDPNEINAFTQSANVELANRTPAEQQQLAPKLVSGGIPDLSPTQYKTAADLYQGILGRAPENQQVQDSWNSWFGDSIDANDVAGFRNAAQAELATRSATPAATPAATTAPASAVSSLGSTENLQNTIGDIYRNAFGRDPDYKGLQDWTNYAQTSGAGVDDLYRSILSAGKGNNEMLTASAKLSGSPTEAAAQVADMYRNVLGRDPDTGGLKYWTDRIVSGESPEKVYNEFLGSARENTELVTADQIKNKNFTAATTPYTGYRSTDQTNIVDEWVRNTLGREPTAADKAQTWYKDAFNAMRTVPEATNLYGQFQDYAKADVARTTAEKIRDATASLAARGLTDADVMKQTGKTIAQLAASDVDFSKNLTSASQLLAPGTKAGFDFGSIKSRTTPQTNAPAGTTNPYGNVTNPGDKTYNADGSITVTPNIPGRPYGGFSGMGEVKDAYTAGGGSLGYTPYAPKTAAEHDAMYNTMTGGSKQAYDYLSGKTPYSATPYTPTGEVMKPYSEATLGMPVDTTTKQYVFDPKTKQYTKNPDYVPVSYNSKGEKVYGTSSRDIISQLPNMAESEYATWLSNNNVTLPQIAQALGISVAEATKRYGKKLAAANSLNTGDNSGGGGDSGAGGGGSSGASGGDSGGDGSSSGAPSGAAKRGGLMSLAVGGRANVMGQSLTKDLQNSYSKLDAQGLANSGQGKQLKQELDYRDRMQSYQQAPQVGAGMANGGAAGQYNLGSYSDGGRLLRGPGDGVSDSIPATIGQNRPARLADGEFVVPARIVSELGNGSTEAGARQLYSMMDRIQKGRKSSMGKGNVANNSRADKHLPA